MIDPEVRINDEWTVGRFVDEFEGSDFNPTDPNRDHFTCDFCSIGVNYSSEPRVSGYVADNVLNTSHPVWQEATGGDERPIVPLASYCKDCSKQRLYFPCEGFAEVRYFFDLDEDRVIRNVRVTDVSPRDDGIPWDPMELSEKITGVDFDQNELIAAIMGHNHLWGPENIVTFFLATVGEIDIRELVKWDGSLDPKVLGQARRQYEEFQKEVASDGHSRRSFRDRVRGDES